MQSGVFKVDEQPDVTRLEQETKSQLMSVFPGQLHRDPDYSYDGRHTQVPESRPTGATKDGRVYGKVVRGLEYKRDPVSGEMVPAGPLKVDIDLDKRVPGGDPTDKALAEVEQTLKEQKNRKQALDFDFRVGKEPKKEQTMVRYKVVTKDSAVFRGRCRQAVVGDQILVLVYGPDDDLYTPPVSSTDKLVIALDQGSELPPAYYIGQHFVMPDGNQFVIYILEAADGN